MEDIPVLDLKKQYESIRSELDDAIARVLAKGSFILGGEVAAFEKEFAAYCGVSHAVGVASGTEALQLALLACGLGKNDEALTAAHTAVATVSAIEATGAHPVLVDIDLARYVLDPNLLEKFITPRTRAIIPVHLYGCPADMNPILKFAREKNLLSWKIVRRHMVLCMKTVRLVHWVILRHSAFTPPRTLVHLEMGERW